MLNCGVVVCPGAFGWAVCGVCQPRDPLASSSTEGTTVVSSGSNHLQWHLCCMHDLAKSQVAEQCLAQRGTPTSCARYNLCLALGVDIVFGQKPLLIE